MLIHEKYTALKEYLASLESVAVVFSEKTVAVTVSSSFINEGGISHTCLSAKNILP